MATTDNDEKNNVKAAVEAATETAPETEAVEETRAAAPSAGAGAGAGRGERRGGRRSPRGDRGNNESRDKDKEMVEKVVFINRCAKVVKGGRRFSFSALVVVGDRKGKVGVGFGKANEVTDAIRKATDGARKRMEKVSVGEATIPHDVFGQYGGGKVLLRPASPGTGLIAGGGVRAVVEAAGVKDVLAKSLGSSNPANVVKATVDALRQLRQRETIFKLRGRAMRPAKAAAAN